MAKRFNGSSHPTVPRVCNARRRVAKILRDCGGDAAREALGVPPPNPLKQQKLRSALLFDAGKIAAVDFTEFDAETEARWQSILSRTPTEGESKGRDQLIFRL
jgi:hypothetical protein